jgi:hypothetical protein
MARRRFLRLVCAGMAISHAALAAPASGTYLSFVGCPIARDTGPDTDLCFITERQGTAYALVNPTDWGTPQLHHQVLVEGRVADGPKVCGATPIEGRVSVLAELDTSCGLVLPFDGSVTGVAGGIFNSGPPEQRARLRALADAAIAQPRLSTQPVMPDPPPEPPPAPPYASRALTVTYPFDSDRGSGPDMLAVTQFVAYARAAQATIGIVSHQGVSRLTGGGVMSEKPGMARQRAEKMAAILTGLGMVPSALRTSWTDAPESARADGEDWRDRRVELTLTPASASKQP